MKIIDGMLRHTVWYYQYGYLVTYCRIHFQRNTAVETEEGPNCLACLGEG